MSKIAIVIPTFNSSRYISDCLSSINNQTYQDQINVYIIDDASQDDTLNIIKKINLNDNINVNIITNDTNKGQGYSRNKALKLINEEYVIFLDSDDMLEVNALELLINKISINKFDMVLSDWFYYNDVEKKYSYKNSSSLIALDNLSGVQCADILSMKVYFATAFIYQTKFLQNNNITFGEGYLYEDYEFIVQCAMNAQSIGFNYQPTLIVRVNEYSVTKNNHDSLRHVESLLKAIDSSLSYLSNRSQYAIYYFYSYAIAKALHYTQYRAPIRLRYRYIKRVLKLLSLNKDYPIPEQLSTLNAYIFNNRFIDKKLTYQVIYKDKRIKLGRKRRKFIKKIKSKDKEYKLKKDLILFAGYDFEFKGNSKYLYKLLKSTNLNIEFIDKDKLYTKEYYMQLNKAKVIILESWSKLKYKKKQDQIYIQLWHGSPIKKMLFDSNEKYVNKNNPKHRLELYRSYTQWDYLLTDLKEDEAYFNKCFVHNNYKLINYGYPRIKYLIDNQNNTKLIKKIKDKYKINKPLVLYAPTWRDTKLNSEDTEHYLNLHELEKTISNYQFIFTDHQYLNTHINNFDIQELLLVCDVVISDYSSIIYDAIKINKKIILYHNDIEKYDKYRGLYHERLFDFKQAICYNTKDIINALTTVNNNVIVSHDLEKYELLEVKFLKLLEKLGCECEK